MKYLFLFLFFTQFTSAQDNTENAELFELLLNDNGYGNGELRIVSNPKKIWLKGGSNSLKEKTTFQNPQSNEKIKITNCEKRKIIRGLKKTYSLEQSETEFRGYKFIHFEEIASFLNKKNTYENSNRVMMFSKPVYIRNGEFAVIYILHMCCGSGGHSNIWFYKKIDGKWIKWIPITQSSY